MVAGDWFAFDCCLSFRLWFDWLFDYFVGVYSRYFVYSLLLVRILRLYSLVVYDCLHVYLVVGYILCWFGDLCWITYSCLIFCIDGLDFVYGWFPRIVCVFYRFVVYLVLRFISLGCFFPLDGFCGLFVLLFFWSFCCFELFMLVVFLFGFDFSYLFTGLLVVCMYVLLNLDFLIALVVGW